jgi:hypothetical protein
MVTRSTVPHPVTSTKHDLRERCAASQQLPVRRRSLAYRRRTRSTARRRRLQTNMRKLRVHFRRQWPTWRRRHQLSRRQNKNRNRQLLRCNRPVILLPSSTTFLPLLRRRRRKSAKATTMTVASMGNEPRTSACLTTPADEHCCVYRCTGACKSLQRSSSNSNNSPYHRIADALLVRCRPPPRPVAHCSRRARFVNSGPSRCNLRDPAFKSLPLYLSTPANHVVTRHWLSTPRWTVPSSPKLICCEQSPASTSQCHRIRRVCPASSSLL